MKNTSIRKEMEFIVQDFFCQKATCSKKVKDNSKNPNKNSGNENAQILDKDEEIDRLKTEIERLTNENNDLRRAIARFSGNDAGLCKAFPRKCS